MVVRFLYSRNNKKWEGGLTAICAVHSEIKDSKYSSSSKLVKPEGKFILTKFEFGGSFGMSLEGDCHEREVTPNLEFLVIFGMSM
jgi:hypothetical protein